MVFGAIRSHWGFLLRAFLRGGLSGHADGLCELSRREIDLVVQLLLLILHILIG